MKTLFSALMSMVVLAACTSPSASQAEQASKAQVQTQQTAQPTLAAKWRVVAFNKFTEKELADKNAYLDFSEMPKAHGNMGCNGMMFQANVIGAGKIDFGPIAVSMMLCEDMKLENAFLRKQSVWNYRFDGNDLILEQKASASVCAMNNCKGRLKINISDGLLNLYNKPYLKLIPNIKETYYGSFSRSQVYRRKNLVDQTPYA